MSMTKGIYLRIPLMHKINKLNTNNKINPSTSLMLMSWMTLTHFCTPMYIWTQEFLMTITICNYSIIALPVQGHWCWLFHTTICTQYQTFICKNQMMCKMTIITPLSEIKWMSEYASLMKESLESCQSKQSQPSRAWPIQFAMTEEKL